MTHPHGWTQNYPPPRCGSLNMRMTASFGPTLCKRMYVCDSCREPFEGFKSV